MTLKRAVHMQISRREIVEWDVRNWSVALDFWLAHSAQNLSGCRALEIGSGSGGLSLWLALQGARVVCSDLRGPRSEAVVKHQAHGASHLIAYHAIDAIDIPYTQQFDIVLFKSVLGAIGSRGGKESQARAIREMHKALKKGGELLFAENLVASPIHKLLRQRYVTWGKRWRYVTPEEMEEFLSVFSQVRYRTIGFVGAFGQSEMQRNLLGILDRLLFDRLVPGKWQYIIAGVARK